jgi:hypothetical protein
VLGCGTAVFDDLFEYMKSLEGLRKLMIPGEGREAREVITVIYPGESEGEGDCHGDGMRMMSAL